MKKSILLLVMAFVAAFLLAGCEIAEHLMTPSKPPLPPPPPIATFNESPPSDGVVMPDATALPIRKNR